MEHKLICVKTLDWVVDDNDRFITSGQHTPYSKVSDLNDSERMEQNIEVIEATFNERDVQCILGTSLSHCELQYEITWALTKDGYYSMKNAYMLRKGGNLDLFIKLGSIVGAWKLAQRYVILFLAHMYSVSSRQSSLKTKAHD